jgi:two-component system LytT family response regulator
VSAPLRVMIVDDEAPAREGLRIRLRREPDVVILGEFGDAAHALDAIRGDVPDLLLLDIEMPGIDGFALLDELADGGAPLIVFVTAHDRHAVHAFDVRALDYLLKPVEQERLHEAIERARERLERARKSELTDRMRGLLHEMEIDEDATPPVAQSSSVARRGVERIAVHRDGTITFVATSDIDWIDAAGDAVRVHAGKTTHVVRRSMGEMLGMLDAERFIRIHRSTIVNVDRVRELQPYFHGEYLVVLRDGTKLKLSRGHRHALTRLAR